MSKKRPAQTTLFGFFAKKSNTKNGTNTASIQEEEPLHTGKSYQRNERYSLFFCLFFGIVSDLVLIFEFFLWLFLSGNLVTHKDAQISESS